MTGGTVVVLGPVGPELRRRDDRRPRIPVGSVGAPRRRAPCAVRAGGRASRRPPPTRDDGPALTADLVRLLGAHRDAGSALAARLLESGGARVRRRLARRARAGRARGGRDAGEPPLPRQPPRGRAGEPPTRNRTATGPSPERCRRAPARARDDRPLGSPCPTPFDADYAHDLPRLRHQPHRRGPRRPYAARSPAAPAAAACSAPRTARRSGSTSPRWAVATPAAAGSTAPTTGTTATAARW